MSVIEQIPPYDFQGARFDLSAPRDRNILQFILSQALYGEATGVYCGKSLYAARSLEAAEFYVRQARQELAHLRLFADIFRALDLEPTPPHPLLKLLSSHNNYYPLKVLMEHAIGEGMVLDVFKTLLLQTLPDSGPTLAKVKRQLAVVCREEEEHVRWGEKETVRILEQSPWLRVPFFGLLELQMAAIPLLVRQFRAEGDHPVLRHVEPFVDNVRARVYAQGKRLGYVPEARPGPARRSAAMAAGALLFARSQLSRGHSTLDKTYLQELGFG